MTDALLADLGDHAVAHNPTLALRAGRSQLILSRYPNCGFPEADLEHWFPLELTAIRYPSALDLVEREWHEAAVTVVRWVNHFRAATRPLFINVRTQNVRRFRFQVEACIAGVAEDAVAIQTWVWWAFHHLPSASRWSWDRWLDLDLIRRWEWGFATVAVPALQDWRARLLPYAEVAARYDAFVGEWYGHDGWRSATWTALCLERHFPHGYETTMLAYRGRVEDEMRRLHERALQGEWIWWET